MVKFLGSIVATLAVAFVLTGCGGAGPAVVSQPPSGGNPPGGGNPGPNNLACDVMTLGAGGNLNGFRPFPSDNLWNKDVSNSPVDPNSNAIINFIGGGIGLHPDFGSGQFQGSNIGIPYIVVGGSQAGVNVNFTAYGDESDPGPMPIPANAPIEGDPNPGSGDRHVLVLDNRNCFLYELYSSDAN
ncbi:MAG TPA: hypothetical protein VH744_05290, partial [Terriglobales bacterium]